MKVEERAWVIDVAVALVAFVFVALGANLGISGLGAPDDDIPAVLLGAAACAVLVCSRRYPYVVFIITTACAAVTCALGYTPTPLTLAPALVALFWLTRAVDLRTTWGLTVLGMASVVGACLLAEWNTEQLTLRTIGVVGWMLLPVFVGRAMARRSAYEAMVRARAEDAERTREEEARRRVDAERIRIARELHDVVAHHIAVAHAQATTAAHLWERNPQQAQQLLTDLSRSTSDALRELKSAVGLLRSPTDDDPEPSSPAPGLDRLDDVVHACHAAGVDVVLHRRGDLDDVPPLVDLTAFRIVQEALTNVGRHAPGAIASVDLTSSDDVLSLRVSNPLTRPYVPGRGGYGILGMHERAIAVGGTVTAHVVDDRFEVTAAFPTAAWTNPPTASPAGEMPSGRSTTT